MLAIASTLGAITGGVFFGKQQLTKRGITLFAFIIGALLVVLPLEFTSRLWLLAENVRGGLQSIPRGQIEAAIALGLNTPLVVILIALPQALRSVIPAIALSGS